MSRLIALYNEDPGAFETELTADDRYSDDRIKDGILDILRGESNESN